MIRPDKTLGINRSAVAILGALYDRSCRPAATVLAELAPRLGVSPERLLDDTTTLVEAMSALLNEDFQPRPGLRLGNFDRSRLRFPTLSEIALTYGCQNRCRFCYASSPCRERERRPMSTEQVKLVMERIFDQTHVPSLSFTGGEPTLRPDLPELIRHGKRLGFRVNLITNAAGWPMSASRSVLARPVSTRPRCRWEAADTTVTTPSWLRWGLCRDGGRVEQVRRLGLHVHTNATLCRANLDHAADLIRFVAHDLKLRTLSMNMVIRTGTALASRDVDVSYTEVGARLLELVEVARREEVRFVWYSPIPYCIFNPVLHGLGAKSCACVDGILSVDPTGQVLPCSSFETGIGSLLERSFAEINASRAAAYWREAVRARRPAAAPRRTFRRWLPAVLGRCRELCRDPPFRLGRRQRPPALAAASAARQELRSTGPGGARMGRLKDFTGYLEERKRLLQKAEERLCALQSKYESFFGEVSKVREAEIEQLIAHSLRDRSALPDWFNQALDHAQAEVEQELAAKVAALEAERDRLLKEAEELDRARRRPRRRCGRTSRPPGGQLKERNAVAGRDYDYNRRIYGFWHGWLFANFFSMRSLPPSAAGSTPSRPTWRPTSRRCGRAVRRGR
jgi:MoaA/NifB/PqqE/SkfB family radical SAM enzyme